MQKTLIGRYYRLSDAHRRHEVNASVRAHTASLPHGRFFLPFVHGAGIPLEDGISRGTPKRVESSESNQTTKGKGDDRSQAGILRYGSGTTIPQGVTGRRCRAVGKVRVSGRCVWREGA
jgi:hypothetical protein